jgi:twitching motility protein PilT
VAERIEQERGLRLHVKVGTPPKVRISGALIPLEHPPLAEGDTAAIAATIVPADRRQRFESTGEVDFAYSLRNVGRFRVNVFRQRGSISAVFRKLRFGGPTFAEMHLPDTIGAVRRNEVWSRDQDRQDRARPTLTAMIEPSTTLRAHIVDPDRSRSCSDDVASVSQRSRQRHRAPVGSCGAGRTPT